MVYASGECSALSGAHVKMQRAITASNFIQPEPFPLFFFPIKRK